MKKGLHNTNKNKGTETLFMFKTIIHDTCTRGYSLGAMPKRHPKSHW